MAKSYDRPGIDEQRFRESIQFPIVPESALQPHRFLDYVRFEARATALGLSPALRGSLAREWHASSQ